MAQQNIQLGLKQNWFQFTLLVLVNAFVGAMVGLERSIFPQFASQVFGVESAVAVLGFIVAFGFSKAIANYFTGKLAGTYGRKPILVLGWLLMIPVPIILLNATTWNWVVFANVLLGISQGFAWSCTVIMKIDLVGPKNRGLAMGLNEFAGYLAVGIMAFVSGWVANTYGVTPYPFYFGIGVAITGLLLSVVGVKETAAFVAEESKTVTAEQTNMQKVFKETTFTHKSLSSITQAGLVNNLNDGMIWGLLPMLLVAFNFDVKQIGVVAAIYPTVWGVGQLFTGKMSDTYNRKTMLFVGMLAQGVAIILLPFANSMWLLGALAAVLGLGTALVYPTFFTAIAAVTTPNQRAETIGVFRFWRDSGYAFGAILSGLTADAFGISYAVWSIGAVTVTSAMVIAVRMPND